MKLGTVTEILPLQRQTEALKQARILLVQTEGSSLAALDRTGAEPGDRVLLVLGHGAARYSMEVPADAVAVAVLKE